MTIRSNTQSTTFVAVSPEPVATSTGATASTWSSYASGYYQTDPAYNVIWENPVPLNDLSKYLSSIPPKDAKRIIGILEDNAKSLEDHLDSGYLKSSGGTVAGATTFGSTVNLYGGVNLGQQSLYTMLPPVGSIMPYAGNKSPLGWLVCDGTAYDTTIYAPLYNVIGSTYNTSTGLSAPASGYFRVPNLKGRMPVGLDAGITEFNTRGNSGGATTVTITVAQMPSHAHTVPAHNHDQSPHNHDQNAHDHTTNSVTTPITAAHIHDNADYFAAAVNGGAVSAGGNTSIFSATATNIANTAVNTEKAAFDTTNTGSGNAVDNMSPYLVLNYIIKT
jgi:microcystin-dependent protein